RGSPVSPEAAEEVSAGGMAASKEIQTTQIRSCVGYLTQVRGDELTAKHLRRVGPMEVRYHKCDAGHWNAKGRDRQRSNSRIQRVVACGRGCPSSVTSRHVRCRNPCPSNNGDQADLRRTQQRAAG